MGSYYQCSDPDSNEKSWTGRIRPLNINRNEFEVTACGSTFHLLVGKHVQILLERYDYSEISGTFILI